MSGSVQLCRHTIIVLLRPDRYYLHCRVCEGIETTVFLFSIFCSRNVCDEEYVDRVSYLISIVAVS